MKEEKINVHFLDNKLINATNPITVNLIGAGGTGSEVLTALMDMNYSMKALGHAGLQVRLWDDDMVTEANLGRQRFAQAELGLYKSVALINKANRWSGSKWSAETTKFDPSSEHAYACIFISCVDNVATRFEIAEALKGKKKNGYYSDRPKYWMDFGNSRYSGQVILSTLESIDQPVSKKFNTVANLPLITDEFGDLLKQSESTDDTPSCSLAEALESQDLFINSALAKLGCNLIWRMFRDGYTKNRGFFLNLEDSRSQPLKVA